jgi:hypothetical protein
MKIAPRELKKLIEYNPTTGLFRWKRPSGHQAVGWFKGNKSVRSYRRLYIRGQHHLAHVVAWALMTGRWPVREMDHIDRDQENNRWSNLRAVTHKQQAMNRSIASNNVTGVHGVSLFRTKRGVIRYRAVIRLNRKIISLGLYDDLSLAAKIRRQAERKYFKQYAPS